jgi:flagellar basal body rod protein FlgC
MGMFDSFNIASTGLTAQRLRMDVISGNIANATTTRTPENEGHTAASGPSSPCGREALLQVSPGA